LLELTRSWRVNGFRACHCITAEGGYRGSAPTLSDEDMMALSGVVLTRPSDDHVRTINTAITATGTPLEFKGVDFFGMPIEHAMILTSTGEPGRQRKR
jgi:hypothetical protein